MANAQTALGTIEQIKNPKPGFFVAMISGKNYALSRDIDTSQLSVGMSIDFEYTESEWPKGSGKTSRWLNKWAKAPTNVRASDSQDYQAPKANGEGMPEITGPYIRPEHLACVSNVLAHAIEKGAQPADVHRWVEAVNCALNGKEWVPF